MEVIHILQKREEEEKRKKKREKYDGYILLHKDRYLSTSRLLY